MNAAELIWKFSITWIKITETAITSLIEKIMLAVSWKVNWLPVIHPKADPSKHCQILLLQACYRNWNCLWQSVIPSMRRFSMLAASFLSLSYTTSSSIVITTTNPKWNKTTYVEPVSWLSFFFLFRFHQLKKITISASSSPLAL